MRIALYEPDIPQNCGALIRLAACLGLGVDIIEPCGFLFSDTRLKRAGMDYLKMAEIVRHASWSVFSDCHKAKGAGRLVLLTSKADASYIDFAFAPGDTILVGRESAGVPAAVHESVDARLRIPMRPGLRSLNVAQAAAMVVGEALRQTKGFP